MEEEVAIDSNEQDSADVNIRRVTEVEAVREAEALFDKPIDQNAAEVFLAAEGHHLLLAYEGKKAVGMVTGVEMTHPDKGTEMFLSMNSALTRPIADEA